MQKSIVGKDLKPVSWKWYVWVLFQGAFIHAALGTNMRSQKYAVRGE